MAVWEESAAHDCDVGIHAALGYETLATAGPPARPLEFPTPTVHRGLRQNITVLDHRTGRLCPANNVLIRIGPATHVAGPECAFLIKKTLSKSVYGVVRLCVVLKRRDVPPVQSDASVRRRRSHGMIRDEDVEWESTEELAVAKISSWAKIRHLRGRHLEDPIKEISALQLVGNYHPNVIGAMEVLQDDEYLYTIMPYCSGGALFGRVMGHDRKIDPQGNAGSEKPLDFTGFGVDEAQVRVWFRQLLSGLFHLQRKGVCHRDVCLENILVDENDRLVIIDLGMCLRVPYTDPCNIGCVTDVSDGTTRLLIQAQGQGGKLMYMAPEVVARDEVFDGFAVDLWAAGIVLFVLLVGFAPFKWAHESDPRYAKVAKGLLPELMRGLNIPLSDEACDLFQNMFWRDPRKRFTLAQVMQHPWVLNRKFSKPTLHPETKPSRIHKPVWVRGVAHI